MPSKNTSTWEPEHHAELERLIASGETFTSAADALTEKFGQTFTRNACCGRAHRMKIKSDPSNTTNTHSASAAGNRNRKKGEIKKAAALVFPAPKLTSEQIQIRCAGITPRNLMLLDLEPNDCRYPYGDGPFVFCGHPKARRWAVLPRSSAPDDQAASGKGGGMTALPPSPFCSESAAVSFLDAPTTAAAGANAAAGFFNRDHRFRLDVDAFMAAIEEAPAFLRATRPEYLRATEIEPVLAVLAGY